MTTKPTMRISNHPVGADSPVFIVAEIGANHDGDVSTAHRLVDIAADAGADAVKLQTYTARELVADYDRTATWGPAGNTSSGSIGELFDRVALPRAAHSEIYSHAADRGLIAFSTPFSEEAVDFLCSIGTPAIKIASSDLNHLRLIRHAARRGVPLILSTGKATLGEVDDAVRAALDAGCSGLAVLHCIASYPAPAETLNLRLINTLSLLYPGCVVGFSDHSIGATADIAAVAMGARIVEKHITHDSTAAGPDHWFSAGPDDLADLVAAIRATESMLGSGSKSVSPEEESERSVSTRSLVTARNVPAGRALTPEDLKVVRPGTGIPPRHFNDVVGLSPTRDLVPDTVLLWSHFA